LTSLLPCHSYSITGSTSARTAGATAGCRKITAECVTAAIGGKAAIACVSATATAEKKLTVHL